jgi:hypothetical protein
MASEIGRKTPNGGTYPGIEGAHPAYDESTSRTFRPIAWRVLAMVSREAAFALGCFMILALAYLYGHSMLEGVLGGNDTTWALALVHWYDKWFPTIPNWYPLQGGGTPLAVFYPPLTSIAAVLIHRVTGLTEVQALAVFGFASVPITGIGIYLLVWTRLHKQMIALVAGLLYPLSGASWYWLTFMGMYAQGISLMFVPFAFMVFDIYLSQSTQAGAGRPSIGRRLVLPGAAILFALTFLTHPATAFVLSMAILLEAIVLPLVGPSLRGRLPALLISIRSALVGIAAGLALAAFWVIPFYRNLSLANREGLTEFAAHQVPYTLPLGLLGIGDPNPSVFSAGLTFALPVVVLACLGLVRAIFRRSHVLPWAILVGSFAIYTSMPGLWLGLVHVFEKLWAFTQARALVPSIILLPGVAAYGAEGAGKAILWAPVRAGGILFSTLSRHVLTSSFLFRMLDGILVTFVTFGVLIFSVVALEDRLPNRNQFGGYGPPGAGGKLPFYIEDSQIRLRSSPEYSISAVLDPAAREAVASLGRAIDLDQSVRIDNTPNLGGLTQALALYSDASTLNAYNYQSSLIHAMWGYQQGLFYGGTQATPQQINQLAGWFGIQDVVLHKELDSLEKYDPKMWPIVDPTHGSGSGPMEIRQYTEAPAMVSLLRAPKVLVIGGFQDAIYEQVFRTFVDAGVGYDQALIVEGAHDVDSYSAKQLAQFDVVLLHGYGYRNRDKAWDLLDEYVRAGGALYVDTGWQYWVPDWQMDQAPDVLPVEKLVWSEYGLSAEFSAGGPAAADDVLVDDFAPLIWEDQSWGVSSPEGGLRSWATPVLSVADHPLVAEGAYGSGKVVWSGMNLIGHAMAFGNAAEKEFFEHLILWLSPSTDPELPTPEVQRPDPDHIRFQLDGPIAQGTSLLWREAFSPDWRASTIINDRRVTIPIYRAGPGMMLLILPEIEGPSPVIEMDYSLGWGGWAGLGLSLAAAVGMTLGVVFPDFVDRGKRRLTRSHRELPHGSVAWAPNLGSETIDVDGRLGEQDARIDQSARAKSAEAAPTNEQQVDQGLPEDIQAWLAKAAPFEDDPSADQLLGWWEKKRSSQERAGHEQEGHG